MGLEPMPHQLHIWDVALEVDDDGRLAYDEIDLSTMRQTSKTTTMFIEKVWRLTMGARMWGPQRATYTAQKRASARNKLEKDFAENVLRSPTAKRSFREITNVKARPQKPSEWKLSLNNGSEHIQFGHGNYFQIDAPTSTAGHGDTLDDGTIDEAFAHANDDVEQAMRPAQATRWNPQLWVGSTAGDEKSPYWYGKVLAGRKQIEEQLESRVCYFEWSIPDDADIDDEDVWWEFMPALGHTISADFVRAELERARRKVDEGGEDLWRRAYGNQWVRVPIMTDDAKPAKLPADKWLATGVSPKSFAQRFPKASTMAFEVTKDGEWASISVGSGSVESPGVQTVEHRRGVHWLPDALVEWTQMIGPIAIGCNGAGPAGAQIGRVLAAFATAKIDANVLRQMGATEYKQACGAFYSHVVENRLRRPETGQLPLDEAAADAIERRLGDAWAWDQRSDVVPVSPLTSATIAVALLPVAPVKPVTPAVALSF